MTLKELCVSLLLTIKIMTVKYVGTQLTLDSNDVKCNNATDNDNYWDKYFKDLEKYESTISCYMISL